MINKIEIENFRSICKSAMNLEKLTVIVGANATGKSNLVKGIEFLSDLVNLGLTESIYKRGGFSEIIPKMYKKPFGVVIKISVDLDIVPPDNWIKLGLPPLDVSYSIGISQSKQKNVKITQEKLSIKHCLLNAYFLKNRIDVANFSSKMPPEKVESLRNSDIEFIRRGETIDFKFNFELTKDNIELLSYWLGIDDLLFNKTKNIPVSKKYIFNFTKSLINSPKPGFDKKHELILSSDRFIEGFSLHFRRVMQEVGSFAKYDLLINELRQEQNISRSLQVSSTGDNVPSVAKQMTDKENADAYARIITTMSNISPYFSSVKSKSLRAGKEYLLFSEIFGGRDIESWESSDGTLRAFAILLSIETHPEGSTVMIEEPEHGLHPWAIKDLISHMRETIKERNIQLILTTHSQQLLECLNSGELLIAERTECGTVFNRISEILSDSNISMGEIGDLWVRGLLKGVPISL